MKKLIFCLFFVVAWGWVWSQNTPPNNVTVNALSFDKIRVAWEVPDGTTQPSRLNLFNQADMVTHPGAGYHGADVSALYGGQGSYGMNSNAYSKFWLADDFTLTSAAWVREMDFFAYQTGSSTISTFTGCFVNIFDTEPIDSTAVPVWTSDTTSCMSSTSWTGIYRTTGTAMEDTTRPIMRIVAEINTTLPAGHYWVAVCFTGSMETGPWSPPRAILGEVSTGNAIQYLPDDNMWGPWEDGTSLEQLGMPFIVRGEFVSENLRGFNVYRDQYQLNSALIEGFDYVEDALEEEHEYCYTVEAVYATGAPAMSDNVCATTPYNPCRIVTMPYHESFDTYGSGYNAYPDVAYPTCWTKINTTTSTSTSTLSYPYISTTYCFSEPGSLYMSAGTNYYTMAITPLLDSNNININTLRATVKIKKSSSTSNYNLVVGTIVNPMDASTFEPYDTLTLANNTNWQLFQVDFNQYQGNAHYIALRSGNGSASNTVYVDDFTLDFIPSCESPSEIAVSTTTANSITVAWTPVTPASLWNIAYKMQDDEDWTEVEGLTATSYTIDNLEPRTPYSFTFKVKAICTDDDESAWVSESISAITNCLAETEFPYTEGFEDYGSGLSGSFYPTCWTRPLAYNTGTTVAPFCNTSQKKTGVASLRFQGGAWAATPQLDVDIHTLQLTFWLRKEGANSGNMQVGVMSSIADTSTFELVETLPVSSTGTWYYYEVKFDSTQLTGSGNYIVFRQADQTSNIYYYWLDDVTVDIIPTCLRPTALSFSEATTTSVTLHWSDESGEGSYELQYKLKEDTVWISVPSIGDTTYLLEDLIPSSFYDVRVRTVCSADDLSRWSDGCRFNTLCTPVSELPYFEGFEDYGYSVSGSEYPICWTRPLAYSTSTTTAPFCNSSQKYTGNASLRFQGNVWAATPQIEEDIHNLQVSFWLRKEGASSGDFQVGVMSNPVDTSTFELVETIQPATTATWYYHEINFNQTQLTGTGNVIAFRQANSPLNNWFYWLDDVDVHYIPTCLYPGNLSFSDATQHSVTLHWSDNNGIPASSFTVRYRMADSEEWSEETAYDTTLTLNSLVAGSTYEWQVKAHCSATDESAWSATLEHFITECGAISSFPYRENFDVYGTGYSAYPDVAYPTCWTKFNNTTATSTLTLSYPYINTTNYTAPGSLYMYAGTSYYTMATLPPVDSSVIESVNQLQLSFWARKASESYNIVVGVMDNPADASSFVAVDTVTPSATNTWELLEVPLSSYQGTGYYITFRCGSGTVTNAFYIDNVVLEIIPTCFRPSDVTVSHIGLAEAMISWNANGNESEWQVNYKAVTDEEWMEISSVTDTFCTLDNLEAGTDYLVKVKALCTDGQGSEYSWEKRFTTLCEPLDSLPFRENFDTYASGAANFPDCWIRQTNSATSYPYVSSSYYVTPSRGLYFYSTVSTTSNTYCYAALPAFSEEVNLRDLQVGFKARKSSAANALEVGVMSDPYDLSTYTVVTTISPTATSTWEDFVVYLNSYTGTGKHIVFKTPDGIASTFYLDDIEVDYAPECLLPTNVSVTNITSSEATVNWGAAEDETEWQIVYGPAGFAMDTVEPVSITINPYTLTNLESNTSYDVYLRTICGNGEVSVFSPVKTFSTVCAPMALPYRENFDSYNTGTSAYPDCWRKINNNTNFPYIFAMTASTGLTLPGALYFSTTATTYAYAVLPEFDAELNTLQMSFVFKAAMGNGYYLDIGVLEDISDTSSFVLVQTIEPRTTAWNSFTMSFTGYEGNGKYIALRSQREGASNICYIDNLTVDYAPGCVAPMNLEAENLTTTTADLTWRPGRDENEWIVAYGPTNFNPNVTGVAQTTTVYPFTVNDLEPGTYYDFYVKAICDDGESSAWSLKGSFRTDCLLIDTLPYVESFDTYGTGTTAFPNCWNRNTTYSTTVQYPYINTTHSSAPGSLYFYSTSTTYNYVTLPEIDESIDIRTLKATFKLRKSSAAYHLKVGVMTNPFDKSTFVEVAQVTPSTTSSWETFTVEFYHYTGEGHFIAFASDTTSSNYIYLDDVNLDFAPTCHEVEQVTVSDITTDQATISWTPVFEGLSWDVEFGPAGFIQGSDAGTTLMSQDTFIILTNLTNSTLYDVYVRQICSDNDESPWSGKVSFSTACTPLTLPYSENFDNASYNATTYNTTGDAPLCWKTYTNNTSYPSPHIIGSGSYHYHSSGTNSLIFTTSSAGYDAYAVLPAFEMPLSILRLSFWRAMESATYGQLQVGYVTNINNIANSFTSVANITTITNSNGGGVDTVDFSIMTNIPANGYIAFHWTTTGTTTFYSCCIDDILVEKVVPCVPPSNLTVTNVTSTSAYVSWQPNGNESSWSLEYKIQDESQWQQQTVNVPYSSLEDLTASSAYDVRVRSLCEDGVESDFVTMSFNTPVGIKNMNKANSIHLMPNPADNYIELRVNIEESVENAVIYNAFGQKIQTVNLVDNHASIDLSDMAAGMYFVRVNGDNVTATKKFIRK
ncbi:MAG: fibronectin type III domain-containing protein [Bacteroidales bacterium]|nr:fibronectin type III domain-containing protein [Bacteroidales bacterium]